MSGRPKRHSRNPSTGPPPLFLSEDLPDLVRSAQQQQQPTAPSPRPRAGNDSSAPPLPNSPPAPPPPATKPPPSSPSRSNDS